MVPRKCVAELLGRPFGGRVGGDVEVDDAAPVVSQHQEYVQHLEADRRHREGVYRDHGLDVIRGRWRLAMTYQIFADGGFANLDAELEQFTMNARRSPKRILATQPTDQCSDVLRNRRPTRLPAPDFPGPEQTETGPVPSNDRIRFDDHQSRPPIAPNRAQPYP